MYLVTKYVLIKVIIRHFYGITYLTNTHLFSEDKRG